MLTDRLVRCGIPVKLIKTEYRSGNDPRAAMLIQFGDDTAAVPVQGMRHLNAEL